MIEFSLLSSGSAGNATLVRCPTGKVLIDNGLSLRALERRLAAIGESLDGLLGVVVTHEHGDHVNGLGVLSRRTGTPLYLTRATAEHLPKSVGKLRNVHHVESDRPFSVGDFKLTPFRVAHDAVDPVNFVIAHGACRLGFATDLGSVSHLVRQRLEGAHALILESNHCPEMLRRSTYPAQIVQRIRSSHGHLSNQDMNSLLAHLLHDRLQLVVAVHISRENNTPEKVRTMAGRVLRNHPAKLVIAAQEEATPLYRVESAAVQARESVA